MIGLAREAAGLTQSGLAKLAGVSQSRVSKVEEGCAVLTQQELQRWSEILNQPLRLFFHKGPTRPASLSFYRKTASVPIRAFDSFNARMNIRRLCLIEELNGRQIPNSIKLPHFPVTSVPEAIEAARMTRAVWNIPSGPIDNVVNLVESAGCIVEFFDFGTDKIDGLAIGGGTDQRFVFLNRDYPIDRRRLSLAHELGHLIMHREIRDSVEDEAWAFAGEFLMPSAEIGPHLFPLSIEKLAQLKLKWRVSMQAILKRAKELGKIQPRYYQFLWMRLGQFGYRKSEPYADQIPPENPTPLEDRMRN